GVTLPFALLVFASACATTPEGSAADAGSGSNASETAEIPYTPKTVSSDPAPAPAANPGGAEVIKPATGGEAAAPAPAAPAAPPPPTFDPGTQSRFKEGVAALNKGDAAGAEAAFKDVLSRNDKAAYAWTNLGIIEERRSDFGAAARNYRRATEVDPTTDVAWDYLTRLECRQRRCAQVESELRAAIGKNPALIGPRNALVYCLLQQQKTDAASSEAKKVLKADERNVRAMQLLAQVYFRESKIELARLVLENARTIDANDAATHNALGLVQLQLKLRPQALESFRQATLLNPDFAEARNNFGMLLNDGNDYESAVKELEAAVAAAPEFTLAHLNLGNAYRGLQQPQKAIAEYQLVQKARPELADVSYNLGVTYLDQDIPGVDPIERFKTAISYFNQYKERGGKDDRVETYIKDANKGIDKEERRKEREKKDQLKKAEQAKKDEENAKKKAAEEAAAAIEAEKKARADAEAKAKADAEAAAKAAQEAEAAKKKADAEAARKAALDEATRKKEEAAAAKKAEADAAKQKKLDEAAAKKQAAADAKAAKEQAKLDAIAAKKQAAEDAKRKKEEEAAAKKKAAEDAKAAKTGTTTPASGKLGDDDPAPAPTPAPPPKPATPAGKLGDDDK
ncbi:MAG: tetratricopeptide repeat protein, partial [Archangium sp.]|nr:tetratricopeptide repeat protein [Archangium sp.]